MGNDMEDTGILTRFFSISFTRWAEAFVFRTVVLLWLCRLMNWPSSSAGVILRRAGAETWVEVDALESPRKDTAFLRVRVAPIALATRSLADYQL